MSWPLVIALAAFALAALPSVMLLVNLKLFRRAPAMPAGTPAPRLPLPPEGRGSGMRTHQTGSSPSPAVSILIPARDEENSIRACVESALASVGAEAEVIVLDDHSRDATADIVNSLAARDPRVRLERAPPLPAGWCGKQHACHALSKLAAHDLLLFIDADVRLAPDAAARAVAFLESGGADLVSGFPRQETGSLLERLLLPLIHVVLLGYLPIRMMRDRPTDPAFGAGCGQMFLARRDAYAKVGGHAAVRGSLHDGITLPRAFRAAGFATDLFDASDVAACRMYRGAAACWHGLAKNATEGMASPRAIVPWTVLLLGGHVLAPVLLLTLLATAAHAPLATAAAAAATGLLYATGAAAAVRFGHPWVGVLLRPVGMALLVAVQWWALLRRLAGRPSSWKGRAYAPAVAE